MSEIFRSFAGGLGTALDMRHARQLERGRDLDLRAKEDALNQQQRALNAAGGETVDAREGRTYTPLATRMADWWRDRQQRRQEMGMPVGGAVGIGQRIGQRAGRLLGRGQGTPTAQAIPTGPAGTPGVPGGMHLQGPPMPQVGIDLQGPPAPWQGFADGTPSDKWDSPERIRERAKASRAQVPPEVERVEGRTDTRSPAEQKKAAKAAKQSAKAAAQANKATAAASDPRSKFTQAVGGKTWKGAAGRLGALGVLGSGIRGALEAEPQGVDDEINPDGPFFADKAYWEGMLPYGRGALEGMGSAVTAPFRMFAGGEEAEAPMAPQNQQALPPPPEQIMTGGYGVGGSTAVSAPRGRMAGFELPQLEQVSMDGIDFSDVTPDEVPDYKTEEWTDLRMNSVRMLISQGVDPATAMNQVDQAVTQMQQRNFLSTLQQGLALQQAGNVQGAKSAYRAAFQFFPTGTDVEFVDQGNGKLWGVAIDEATGKVVPGSQQPLDPQAVALLIETYTNPEAFRQYAKDARDFQMQMQQYLEVGRPLAQAQGSAALTNAQANADRAAIDRASFKLQANSGYGGPNMRPSDWDRAASHFREEVDRYLLDAGVTDASVRQRLAADMSRIKRARPDIDNNVIMQMVMQAAGGQ